MLRRIRVVPLAAESLGVRSMCTYVETPDVNILLDPGVSLGPNRFGYPPHPREYEAIAECRRRISEASSRAEAITISHYHFDHHTPSFEDWCCNWSSPEVARQIYEGKLVLAKSYRDKVNFSQRHRGWMFAKTGGKYATKIETADGKAFNLGDTEVRFSDPVFHGPRGSPLGWLVMTTVRCHGEKAMFASDVQGPMHDDTLKAILSESPRLIVVGGPPLYLADFRMGGEDVRRGLRNLTEVVRSVPVIILEHHLLRDVGWRQFAQPVFDAASQTGHTVLTAAEFTNRQDNLLEANRKKLFEDEPPSPEFERWMKLPYSKRRTVKPPI